MSDSRFVLAVHTLVILAHCEDRSVQSCQVAESVNTNPVVIRRITAQLAKAGLIRSTPGAGGGSQLARPAKQITLRHIYEAVGAGEIFAFHATQPNQGCMIGAHIQSVLRPVLASAADCVAEELGKTTLADILANVSAARTGECDLSMNKSPGASKRSQIRRKR